MYRRMFVEACLTVLLLVTVGTPAMASPFTSAGSATQEAAAAARVRATIPVSSALVVATNPTTNTI